MNKLIGIFLKNDEEIGIFRRMATENFVVYRKQYAIAIVCLLIIAGITAFSAWLMAPIVDEVFLKSKDYNQAIFLSLTVVIIFIIKGFVTYLQAVTLNRIGNSLVARYQRRLFSHLLTLGVGFFNREHSVELISRLNQNVNAVRMLLNTVVLGFVRDLVTLIALIGVMFYRDIYMALTVFIIGPLALGVLASYARRVRRIAREEVQINAQVSTSMQEAAHGIQVVKSFTMEDQLREKLNALTRLAEGRSNKIARITARTSPLMETLAGFAIAGVIAYGGWRVVQGGYSTGALTSFMTALLLAYEPAKRLARMRVELERSIVSARMIYEVLDTPIRQADRPGAAPLALKEGRIVVENVDFHYGQDPAESQALVEKQPVLEGLSFIAEAGKTTALVGPSGGGKSTIIALLQRFYDVESGEISIDGQNIANVTVASLRDKVAYVSQQPVLFQGTIRENLRYARPDASDVEMEAAAKAAQAHGFITALPLGYDTPLGENGTNLSGGQRQRLSIARAIVRNAPILLLDEATSALDNESEAKVQSALEKLMKGRTTIVIAHRLSTIANADKIVVVDNGKVVDQGNHKELMNSGGVYARLQNVSGASASRSSRKKAC